MKTSYWALILTFIACIAGGLVWSANHYHNKAIEYKKQRDENAMALDSAMATISDMQKRQRDVAELDARYTKELADANAMNRPGFPGECFICELRLPDHRFRWKHNKLFLLL
ncbi:lysis system i-spanin subunit Rz, partial [Escherichia coli]